MISLELFKKIINDIQKQDETDRKLTKLLVSKHCTGFVSTAEDVINDLTKLMAEMFQDEYEYIEWYLYEVSEGHRFVYEDIKDSHKQTKYDLNDVESLYYYLIGDYDKVPKTIVDENVNQSQCNIDYDTEYIRKAI